MKAQKKKILPGIAVHNLQFAICSLHFTFVGLDLCRSAMLRALWPWLLLLPIWTTLRLKNQLLVFLVMNNVNQGLDWWSWLESNSKFNYGRINYFRFSPRGCYILVTTRIFQHIHSFQTQSFGTFLYLALLPNGTIYTCQQRRSNCTYMRKLPTRDKWKPSPQIWVGWIILARQEN